MEGSHFAISTNFLVIEQLAKDNIRSGLHVSNQVIPAWRTAQEEVDHRISTIRLLAAVEEDKSLTTRILAENFNVFSKNSERYGNWLDGSLTNSLTKTKQIVSEFSPNCWKKTSNLLPRRVEVCSHIRHIHRPRLPDYHVNRSLKN